MTSWNAKPLKSYCFYSLKNDPWQRAFGWCVGNRSSFFVLIQSGELNKDSLYLRWHLSWTGCWREIPPILLDRSISLCRNACLAGGQAERLLGKLLQDLNCGFDLVIIAVKKYLWISRQVLFCLITLEYVSVVYFFNQGFYYSQNS